MSRALLRDLDPRHSLVAGLIWLVIGLAVSFAVAASVWAGRVAREIVVQQHVRRLVLETDQLASDLGQAVSTRLAAIHAADGNAPPGELFKRLVAAYPDLGWISLADPSGVLLAANGSMHPGSSVGNSPWFQQGLKGPWIGVIEESRHSNSGPLLGDLSAPLHDSSGRIVGVIAAHLNWPWAASGCAAPERYAGPPRLGANAGHESRRHRRGRTGRAAQCGVERRLARCGAAHRTFVRAFRRSAIRAAAERQCRFW